MSTTLVDTVLHKAEQSSVATHELLRLLKIVLHLVQVLNSSLVVLCDRVHLLHTALLLCELPLEHPLQI